MGLDGNDFGWNAGPPAGVLDGSLPNYSGVDISAADGAANTINGDYGTTPGIIDTSVTVTSSPAPPDGISLGPDTRANQGSVDTGGNILGFDQSKVSASMFDLLKSGGQAIGIVAQNAVKTGNVKQLGTSYLGTLLSQFSSTKTGAQIQQQALAAKVRQWFSNPLAWVIAGAFVFLIAYGIGVTRRHA